MSAYPYTATQANLAAIDEMSFWLRIMYEHSKFIRGGLNPSISQEHLIQTADDFARNIERLHAMVVQLPPTDAAQVSTLMTAAESWVRPLRDFKAMLFSQISACQVIAELPAPLLDHIRREADYFLTMLDRIQGDPVPLDETLGIPDGSVPTSVVPRLLIPATGPNLLKAVRDANLFWLRIHMEHGEVLLLIAYRPRIQEMLYDATAKFERDLEALLNEAKVTPLDPRSLREFDAKAYVVMVQWRDFLIDLYQDVLKCDVPSGQINTDALILDHMAREASYYIEVLGIEDRLLEQMV